LQKVLGSGIFGPSDVFAGQFWMGVAVKISIVVPAFNEEKLLGASLGSISDAARVFTERGWAHELIVCDNNSTDRTTEIARAAGAKVVLEPVNQIARARNTGAAAATGDWLLFVDADSRPTRGLFEDAAAAMATGLYLAGGVTVRLDGSHLIAGFVTGLWNCLSRIFKWVAGSFIFCETTAFREIGGFDTNLYASEEINLSKRLKRLAQEKGRRLVILHRHPLATSDRKLHLYSYGEYARFLTRTLWHWGGTVRDQKSCHIWYDGRR
jgi:glycosyltransferase involved in cell wall biosynthesis